MSQKKTIEFSEAVECFFIFMVIESLVKKLTKCTVEVKKEQDGHESALEEFDHDYYRKFIVIWKPRCLSSMVDAEDEIKNFITNLKERIYSFQKTQVNKKWLTSRHPSKG